MSLPAAGQLLDSVEKLPRCLFFSLLGSAESGCASRVNSHTRLDLLCRLEVLLVVPARRRRLSRWCAPRVELASLEDREDNVTPLRLECCEARVDIAGA